MRSKREKLGDNSLYMQGQLLFHWLMQFLPERIMGAAWDYDEREQITDLTLHTRESLRGR